MHPRVALLPLLAFLASCAPGTGVVQDDAPFAETAEIEALGTAQMETGATLGTLPHAVPATGLLSIGNQQAPHTLLLFLTPGSPYSQEYVETLLPNVVRTVVTEGKLKIHVAFVPFAKYPQTETATAALLCAAEQGYGTEALSALIVNPLAFATAVPAGADKDAFRACLERSDTLENVRLHAEQAASLGVTGVPTAFLDGERHTGLPEQADLEAVLARALR